jgi:hypothetical protein
VHRSVAGGVKRGLDLSNVSVSVLFHVGSKLGNGMLDQALHPSLGDYPEIFVSKIRICQIGERQMGKLFRPEELLVRK